MKKIILFIFIFTSSVFTVFGASSIREDMIPDTETIAGNTSDIETGTGSLMPIFLSFKNIILGLLAIIAVAIFIYLGFKLVKAEGKPDEFKKVMLGFVYAVIGLSIIPLAWAMVKLISSLQF
ncbi:MAG: hypothetical protein PHR68_00135 [Candidatus Gracilibacteria bacterium]|nr:hypothetical protein [Candidatus Gracilibacteria bacterium]